MEKPTKLFEEIAGVKINYDRDSAAAYGTKGRRVKAAGPVTDAFYSALVAWANELIELCPWMPPELIVTGGVRGPGTDPANRHTQGRAFDLDGIWWPGRAPLVARRALEAPVLYCAVDCTLRLHFGTVLNYWYNQAHEDHWHVDDGRPVEWRLSRSGVLALQAALRFVWGAAIDLDGVWGAKTLQAYLAALQALERDDPRADWIPFLRATAARGFQRAASQS